MCMLADMLSADMLQEQSRRNWEEESKRRHELEQLAEDEREQRVEARLQPQAALHGAHYDPETMHNAFSCCSCAKLHCAYSVKHRSHIATESSSH